MTTLYRGTIGHPIVFPESVIITTENLDSIDFNKVIYCEISPMGAMGNEGGIFIYLLDDKEKLTTYETNVSVDKESYNATLERINQKANLFTNHSGGMGNYVYIKKGVELEIDEKYNCFWYHSQNTKLRIDSSVRGVFLHLVAEMKR
ncbi:hypothetical protein IPJ70_04375 [Candidatus Campbellbacteria bacterium]|nr:MAG: hypothetical protein IPJ70_04375 [Candidatus Campbellbacteria bacterium]